MIRIFLILLLIYLIFRFIRNITVITMGSRRVRKDDMEKPAQGTKPTKIISKNEGEYVDFEEVKK
jgi:hypothetical protein